MIFKRIFGRVFTSRAYDFNHDLIFNYQDASTKRSCSKNLCNSRVDVQPQQQQQQRPPPMFPRE